MSHHRIAQTIPQNTAQQHASAQNSKPINGYTTPFTDTGGALNDLLEYNGGPIPESARQSYLQQKLPVRKQSLVAYGRTRQVCRQKIPARRVGSSLRHPPPDRLMRSLTTGNATSSTSNTFITSDNGCKSLIRSATVTLRSSPSMSTSSTSPSSFSPANNSSNDIGHVYPHTLSFTPTHPSGAISSTNDLHSTLPTIQSATSSMVTAPIYLSPPLTVTVPRVKQSTSSKDDDDDDFYFGDRTPSTIDCTQPNISTASIASLYVAPSYKQYTITALDNSYSTAPQNTIDISANQLSVSSKSDDDDNDDDDDNSLPSPTAPTINDNSNEARFKATRSEAMITDEGIAGEVLPAISVEQSKRPSGNDNKNSIIDNTTNTVASLKQPSTRIQRQRSYYTPALSPSLSAPANIGNLPLRSTSHFYPALLSHIAQELYRRLPVRTLVIGDTEYQLAFNGKEAVDCLLQVLRASDRNLGLLVGRALDHQHFFYDVTHKHHLRDSQDKIYQFKRKVELSLNGQSTDISRTKDDIDKEDLPNGIFALLTTCYSPTCARGQGCYSTYCPRKGKSIKRPSSQKSHLEKEQECKLWIQSVPKAVIDASTKEEIKRQECIYELIYTEGDFVKDLHYVHKLWVQPLITQDIIPDERREHFVQEVFWNLADIEKVNTALFQALTLLQKQHHVVNSIGGVLLEHVCRFDPFISYGSHQMIGKFKLELEKKRNPVFAGFVQTTERRPESRRLELDSFLAKPLSRLGKYNLLLREILRRTPRDNPDFEAIPKVMDIIVGYLIQVNAETGKCENIFNLQQIEERLSFKSTTDHVDLALRDPQRQLILRGRMKRKGNDSSESSDLQVLLFDHYLVFAKIKYFDHLEYYKVHRKPIPLNLLTISTSASNTRAKRASTLLAYSRTSIGNMNAHASIPRVSTSDNIIPAKSNLSSSITFYHHGRKGSPPMTLYASTAVSQKTWMEKILRQQNILSAKQAVFALRPIVDHQFTPSTRIYDSLVINYTSAIKATTVGNNRSDNASDNNSPNPKVPDCNSEDKCHAILFGTDMGVYIRYTNTKLREDEQWDFDDSPAIKRVIHLDRITQMELMEDSQLLVLADKTLWTFALADILSCKEKLIPMKKGRIISTNTAFFHVGECMDKTLVCIVKPNTLSTTTIRVLEPIANIESKKPTSGFSIRRLGRSGPVGLKPYKDLYLPSEASSINLLKSKMCITCLKEIGVVDMKAFGVQALLDPGDEELAFVFSRPNIRPITIYRLQFAEYLVCYDEFGFFVDQRGRWIRSSHIMEWEGEPDAFALSYPYLLGFEPGFIEIRNIISGKVEQLIRGRNIRCTNSRQGVIQGSMNALDNDGHQVIFQLNRI